MKKLFLIFFLITEINFGTEKLPVFKDNIFQSYGFGNSQSSWFKSRMLITYLVGILT